MQPKKLKHVLPAVASQLNLQHDLVEAVSSFFWDQTRKALGQAPKLKVHIANLGDFTIKHWKLDDELIHYKHMLAKVNNNRKPNPHLVVTLEAKVSQLERLKNEKLQEDQRKEFIHEYKNKRDGQIETSITADLEE